MNDARPFPRRTALVLPLAAPARATPVLGGAARILVGVPPGSIPDLLARILAPTLAGHYAEQVTVENRPGAATRLAVEAVKAAAPDGRTILLSPHPALTLFPHVYPRTTRYDALVDFAAVASLGQAAFGLAVPASSPARDLGAFLDTARAQGGANFAPSVIGSPQHFIGLALGRAAGVSMNAVPYQGGVSMMPDLYAGRIDAVIAYLGLILPGVHGGQSRLLAVSGEARLAAAPGAPSFAESGFPGLPEGERFSLFLPARTPASLVAALEETALAACSLPAVREAKARIQLLPPVLGATETAASIAAERDRWGRIVRASGFTAEE